MISFIPYCPNNIDINDLEGTGEFLFLLDRSGSMNGKNIEIAKNSIILFLKSLPVNSKFNIISFGSGFQFLYPESQVTNNENLAKTIRNVKEFTANLGNTNIYRPLDATFKQNALEKYPRIIFLLTDGEVENKDLVVDLIKFNSNSCRVHSFGIGSGADKSLISESAKAGKGCSYFIEDSNRLGEKVINALKKSILPCLKSFETN